MNKKCCEKCLWNDPILGTSRCDNGFCSCHSQGGEERKITNHLGQETDINGIVLPGGNTRTSAPTDTSWEKRFDEYFYDSEHSLKPSQVEHIKGLFKELIRQTVISFLEAQNEEMRKDVRKMLDSAKFGLTTETEEKTIYRVLSSRISANEEIISKLRE